MAQFYGIENLKEAEEYLAHSVLGKHLVAISEALRKIDGKSANDIFIFPDDLKVHSSMTLFATADKNNPVFRAVMEKYFNGIPDE